MTAREARTAELRTNLTRGRAATGYLHVVSPAVQPGGAGAAMYPGPVTVLVAGTGDAAADGPGLPTHGPSLRELAAAQCGVEVEVPGAPFAAVFVSARRAVRCAIGIQRTLAGSAAAHPEEPMRVGIALHTGEANPGGAGSLEPVLLAAGIARHARGGEIVVSAALRELAGADGAFSFGPGRAVDIEGQSVRCTVYEIAWGGAVGTQESTGDVFRREGDYWTIAWRGGRCRVRDVRGLHYLAQLLRHPGREFHALDLVGSTSTGMVGGARSVGMPALDAQAKQAYRRRLAEVREDLDEAEERADAGGAWKARAELEAITEQLATAVGLGGRDRVAAAAAERARCAVTQGIRCALRRIGPALPQLANELRLRVRTGVYCIYHPDPAHPSDWDL